MDLSRFGPYGTIYTAQHSNHSGAIEKALNTEELMKKNPKHQHNAFYNTLR